MDGRRSALAQRLRKEATTAESILWSRLRGRQLNNRKWRRQQPIGRYVVDFCCQELLLIAEIDGEVHGLRQIRDMERQRFLEDEGYRVVRFTNDDVLRHFDGVATILWELTQQTPETPSS